MAESTQQSKEDAYFALKAKATLQASIVKQAKKDGASAELIAAEVDKLTALRAELCSLAGMEQSLTDTTGASFNRKAFDELILRKMYVVPSFEIHNGPAGLFDYGPAACALKANVLQLWRQHFVLEVSVIQCLRDVWVLNVLNAGEYVRDGVHLSHSFLRLGNFRACGAIH